MPEKKTISELMLKNHRNIEKRFAAFNDSLERNFKSVNKTFNKFRIEAQKHFRIEEEAIFRVCHGLSGEMFTVLPNLIKEHDIILELVNDIENNLGVKKSVSLLKIKKLLTRHKYCEDRFLYPQLDKCLTKSQKDSIVRNLKKFTPKPRTIGY